MDKQIVVDPYNRILYSVINRNELLIHAKTWMNLEITKLNKRGLTQKSTYGMIIFILNVQNWEIYRESSHFQGLGGKGNRE